MTVKFPLNDFHVGASSLAPPDINIASFGQSENRLDF